MVERKPINSLEYIKSLDKKPEVLFVAVNTINERDFIKVRQRGTAHALPPLGPLSVASYLKGEKGINAAVLDAEQLLLNDNETVETISKVMPEGGIVGWATWIISVDRTARMAKRLKELRPDLGQMAGGPHASAVPIATMEKYGEVFDYLIVGEGEIPSSEVIKNWGNDEYLKKIPGVVFKRNDKLNFIPDTRFGYTRPIDKRIESVQKDHNYLNLIEKDEIEVEGTNGKFVRWPRHAERVETLDNLPLPAYYMLGNLDKYHLSEFTPPVGESQISAMLSRGCSYACFFCDQEVSGHSYRSLSPERIVEYYKYLRSMGPDYFYVTDDLYIVRLDEVEETARRIIETPELNGIRWEAISRAELTDKAANKKILVNGKSMNILELMYKAGCRQIHIAPETGNEELRKQAIGKPIKNSAIEHSVNTMAEIGIRVKLLNMVGLPGETPKETMETLKYIQKLGKVGGSYAMISICTPLPTTPLAQAIEYGSLKWTGDLSDWEKMTLWDAAGIFTTDLLGNKVDNTPLHILEAARGKHRLGKLVNAIDHQRGETIEQKINEVQSLIDEYYEGKTKNYAVPVTLTVHPKGKDNGQNT